MPAPDKKLNIIFAKKSDIGLVRTENQDSLGKFPEENTNLYSPKGQLFIVADGMGGHKGGKEASTIAVRVVKEEYFSSSDEEPAALRNAIVKANNTIYNESGDKSEIGRMGTTCSALVLREEKGIIGHVGDSRVYRIENGDIEQLTNDHTQVQEMLRAGILTPEEAKSYPAKSVLARALGVDENVKVDIIEDIKLKPGQSYILCSDGLAKVSQEEILTIVSENNPEDACSTLVDLANDRGGKDNVTVIVVKVDSDQAIGILAKKQDKEKKDKPPQKKSRSWLAVFIALFIILVMVFVEFRSSLFTASPAETVPLTVKKPVGDNVSRVKSPVNLNNSETKMLDEAEKLFKQKEFDQAYSIYRTILNNQPMHQAALDGVNEIAEAYSGIGDKLMNEKNFEGALNYYKKAEEVRPGNEKIHGLIRLCISQLPGKEMGIDSSAAETLLPAGTETGSVITASNFNSSVWTFPGINKNEFTINNDELSFTNTLSEKFIIYDKDLLEVTFTVNIEIDNPNTILGLIIGYVSPTDYYIFRYRDGGNYTLQRIKGNDVEKLLVIRPTNINSSNRKIKIMYSDNLISLYDQNGLISSYKSAWGIIGKAGIYVDKTSSVKFRNILLSGKTKLD